MSHSDRAERPATQPTHNVRAIVLILLAMVAFTIEDSFIKALSMDVPIGQILLMIGTGGSLIFAAMALRGGHSLTAPQIWRGLPLWRAISEAISSATFVAALSLIDISVAAAVFQATPLAVTMGAALFLGEAVGWRRWTAVTLGFLGVLVIIRPGFAGFQPVVLIVLITVISIAARDLITRRLNVSVASSVVSFQGFLAAAVAGLALTLIHGGGLQSLSLWQWAAILAALTVATSGYYGIVLAMRLGEASVVMPFRYTRLIFSLIAGMLIFHEHPDALTLLGAGLIIGCGLYTFLRERRLARLAKSTARP